MDANTPLEVLGKFPCFFRRQGATPDACYTISSILEKNLNGCTHCACRSPWRLCVACIRQTTKPNTVAEPGERLCAFHKEHGEATKLPPAPVPPGYVGEDKPPTLPETAEEGRAILERVRLAISNASYEVVPVELIRRMPNQPRKYFNEVRLLELTEAIKSVGQITPGYLRRIDPDGNGHEYELVDGERRWRAILMADVPMYRAMVVQIDEMAAQFLISLIANFHREGHTVLEIVDAICMSHEVLKLGMKEIGDNMGFHPIYVTNLYGLRRLIPEVRNMLDPELGKDRMLPTSAAIEISRLPPDLQLSLAQRVLKRELPLHALRGEVVTASRSRGIVIMKRDPGPSEQRRSVMRHVTPLDRHAGAAQDFLEEMPPAIIRDWDPIELETLKRKLIGSRNSIDAALAALERASGKK